VRTDHDAAQLDFDRRSKALEAALEIVHSRSSNRAKRTADVLAEAKKFDRFLSGRTDAAVLRLVRSDKKK
jgi:hypothetical protein